MENYNYASNRQNEQNISLKTKRKMPTHRPAIAYQAKPPKWGYAVNKNVQSHLLKVTTQCPPSDALLYA